MTKKNRHHPEKDLGDIVMIRANDFLESMIVFCDGDPDKVLEGMQVFMLSVMKECERRKKSIDSKK